MPYRVVRDDGLPAELLELPEQHLPRVVVVLVHLQENVASCEQRYVTGTHAHAHLVLDHPEVEGALGVDLACLPDLLDLVLEEGGAANDDVLHDGRERHLR